MKPILFNTDMVKAILEGRKTVTRRVIKPQPRFIYANDNYGPLMQITKPHKGVWFKGDPNHVAPYQTGDILYVRETWAHPSEAEIDAGADPGMFLYRTDRVHPAVWGKWCPNIHMPREAARLFLDGAENPALFDMNGIPLYKYVDGAVQARGQEEIGADRALIPPPPPSPMEQLRADVDFIAAMGGVEL